ncbi:MAG: pyridoxal phosphate-dependent aminotransferase [Anaerolineaceae bacterium]|nr:pyridoxal phosphate-dependent aminotransferase [Anaerolineaceae bacterium]
MTKSYLSQRAASLKPSAIRKFFDIAATMKDIISLGIGEPDFDTPKPIVDAGVRSLLSGETHYTSNVGVLELRKTLSTHLERLYNVHYEPDQIVITVGGSEALYLAATALLDPGDEVIVLTPCFVAYQAEVFLSGGVPVEVACRMENNFEVDPKDVEAAITPRTKAILMGFPSNPTGAVASRDTLLQIARLAEEHDLIVLSDEIYDRLVYGGEHICFPALPGMQKRTILLGGFSKDYAMTGWRIGYVAAPAELITGLLRVHQYTVMCASTTAQMAAIAALRDSEEHVAKMVAEYDRRRRLIVDGLNRIGLPTFEPRGAFYAFPKVSVTGLDDNAFSARLLEEEHVAAVPGSGFGKGGEGFIRCSYATSYDKIEEALRRMERFVNRL